MLEMVPDIAQSTHGIRNIFADIRNVPTRPHKVLGMFLLAFPVAVNQLQLKWPDGLLNCSGSNMPDAATPR